MLGNIGTVELFVIMLTILLVFGAKRIPEIARALGDGIREFREAGRAIADELRMEDDLTFNRRVRTGRRAGSESRFDPRSAVHHTMGRHDGGIVSSETGDPPILPEDSADAGVMPS